MKSYFHSSKIRLASGTFLLLILIGVFYSQITSIHEESRMQSIEVPHTSISRAVYEQALPSLDRNPMSLAKFKGKILYIKFWATWCPLCLAGIDDFTALANQLSSSSSIAVISIVTPGLNGEVSKNDFIDWAKARQLSFPIYFDESGTVSKELGVLTYPTAVYLGKDGTVMKKTLGDELNAQILHRLNSLEDK